MSKPTVLITGTNRGIGLEFVKQYVQEGWQVLACCRNMNDASTLGSIADMHKNISIHELDVADFDQIESLADILSNQTIDILINNAGVYPQSEFGDVDEDAWALAFKINAMAPLKMAEAFTANIARSQLKKIVTLSSKMGSIDDNSSGGSYIYRTSKVAVNMVMKSLSIDLKPYGIICATLHPGWVLTEMGGENALITTTQSVTGLRNVIQQLTPKDAGQFFSFDGKKIPW